MKLKFKDQQYQTDAVNAVADLFIGNNESSEEFDYKDIDYDIIGNTIGYKNRLNLDSDQILKNLQNIQSDKGLEQSKSIDMEHLDFTIEMETGTGKTFVYIKTILELNKRYGFKRFIIVVPSVAIREGVKKSFDITKEYFKDHYNAEYKFHIYDSKKLSQVSDFINSNNIEIMIINIAAFIKEENIIKQEQDKFNGRRPIDLIQACKPIVIIDEPQSVNNTDKSKNAILLLNPIFTLRYSATHREKINTVYKLTPVDAYEMGLVKQICVISDEISNDFNQPYIKLLEVNNKNGFKAKIELDIDDKGIIKRKIKTVKDGEDLYEISGQREIYKNYIIDGIACTTNFESVNFRNTNVLKLGQVIGGGVELSIIRKNHIKRTIEAHLNKELIYTEMGIKVLSLFFIDEVKKYRDHENLHDTKGEYAKMFEEVYSELLNYSKYKPLKEKFPEPAGMVHDGYFSKDKKSLKNTEGNSKVDEDTYNLIMKDKEKLLSFDCPIRFIFSHSALKEGWDNPNVFQVCTMIDKKSPLTCRQKIGRGLRLCVNQNGERIEDKNINVLHVIAGESFSVFADKLQKEIEDETGFKFGCFDICSFANIKFKNGTIIDSDQSIEIYEYMKNNNYLDSNGRVTNTLKEALNKNNVNLPSFCDEIKEDLINFISNMTKNLPLKHSGKEVRVKLKESLINSAEFMKLWNKIKYRTKYSIDIDEKKFFDTAVKLIKNIKQPPKIKLSTYTAIVEIENQGVIGTNQSVKTEELEIPCQVPDMVFNIVDKCKITPNLIIDIFRECNESLKYFQVNPQYFMGEVIHAINEAKFSMVTDGIKYSKVSGGEYYLQDVFEDKEIIAYLNENALEVKKNVYDHLIYDSGIENDFAKSLEMDDDVKVYAKLPSKFKINTPIGSYNPDWAIVINQNDEERLYFVIETKSSAEVLDINRRSSENIKIHCGIEHFKALETDIELKVATSWWDFKKEYC